MEKKEQVELVHKRNISDVIVLLQTWNLMQIQGKEELNSGFLEIHGNMSAF